MMIENLTDDALLAATRGLVERSLAVTADLLVHLGEIDARKLYLARAFPSMFALCVTDLGFSEDVAYNRIMVARLARRLPTVLDALRSGRVHLAGLRLLAPHLTEENSGAVLAEATGKSKRQIEELTARFAPKPPVASMIRRVAEPHVPAKASPPVVATPVSTVPLPVAVPGPAGVTAVPIASPLPAPPLARQVVKPLAEDTFKVQFTARRPLHDKLKEAQDLMRHSVPDGDLAEIVERGLDLLIAELKKKKFGVGRKARTPSAEPARDQEATRHVPDAMKRQVYERDGGRCTFVADDGRRCPETGGLELDHTDGFARTRTHAVDALRLRCRGHNQHAADEMYGAAFMAEARRSAKTRDGERAARPGASPETSASPQSQTTPLLI
jgi:hypothetical protein